MQTSSHAGPMLRINCSFFSLAQSFSRLQISSFSPTHPHMRTFTDNDNINMPDSSSLGTGLLFVRLLMKKKTEVVHLQID
jgi:hypothetical protein